MKLDGFQNVLYPGKHGPERGAVSGIIIGGTMRYYLALKPISDTKWTASIGEFNNDNAEKVVFRFTAFTLESAIAYVEAWWLGELRGKGYGHNIVEQYLLNEMPDSFEDL